MWANATAEGITRDLEAMAEVVSTKIILDGGKLYEGHLPKPPSKHGYYRDIAVLAYPSPGGTGLSSALMRPKVTTNIPGPDLAGRTLWINHTDSWEARSQNWSPLFREEFIRRRGDDPVPWLPAMQGVPVGSAELSERFLYDVRKIIADLVCDHFYAPFVRLGTEQGTAFSAECIALTMMADGLQHFKYADFPMGEFWLNSVNQDKPNDIMDAVCGGRWPVSSISLNGYPGCDANLNKIIEETWKPHYSFDITDHIQTGQNELKIEVANTWKNRLLGDSRLPEKDRVTWTLFKHDWFKADAALLPSGLLGPLELVYPQAMPMIRRAVNIRLSWVNE
jgi:hypothetical protein